MYNIISIIIMNNAYKEPARKRESLLEKVKVC